jgi:hypothetical protein
MGGAIEGAPALVLNRRVFLDQWVLGDLMRLLRLMKAETPVADLGKPYHKTAGPVG